MREQNEFYSVRINKSPRLRCYEKNSCPFSFSLSNIKLRKTKEKKNQDRQKKKKRKHAKGKCEEKDEINETRR